MSALFGGRMPMTMTSPPGGVNAIVNLDLIAHFLYRLKKVQAFVDNVFIPDVLAVAPFYLDWAGIGKGHGNYLAWGVFEDLGTGDPYKRLLPRGAVYADKGLAPQKVGPEMVTEDTTHGFYKNGPALNPAQGETIPDYTGFDTNSKYTWAKAPRLNGKPMEVGALSRMLVAYVSGQPQAKELIDGTLTKLGVAGKPEVLMSVLGRIAARALETKIVADAMVGWTAQLAKNLGGGNTKFFQQYEIPDKAKRHRPLGSAARRVRALEHHREQGAEKLPDGRTDYLERGPERRQGHTRADRGGPHRDSRRGPDEAPGNSARGAFFRPVPRLYGTRDRPRHERGL